MKTGNTRSPSRQSATMPGSPGRLSKYITSGILTALILAVFLTPGLQAPPTAEAQSGDSEDTCPGGGYNPTPTAVEIQAVPIVVESTTSDYFVLYVQHDVDEDTSIEIPVLIEKGAADTTTLAENVEALPKERYRVEKYQIANPADIDGDCIDDMTELQNLGEKNPLNPAAATALSDGAVAIPDQDTFETLAEAGRYVKFLVFGLDSGSPHVYFINTNTHTLHAGFLQALTALGIEESAAGDRYHGVLTYHPELQSADGSPGVYSVWIYRLEPFAVNDRLYTLFAANMPLLDDNFAYHLREQWRLAYNDEPLYEASRINLLLDEDVAPESDFIPMNKAAGYGMLRAMGLEDSPNPRDVVIYEALPNELSRVAGIITTVAQTPLSHVNLRAVQDGVPNAFIRGALDKPEINALIGHYVQYTVTTDGYAIRAATKSEIDNHHASSRPATAQTPQRDLSVTEITPLSGISFDDWDAFGVKAANVAVLRTLDFPEGTVPDGFAIPFYFYDEFMKHNNFYARIETMLADPDFQSNFDTQEDELKDLRDDIEDADTPAWIVTALATMNESFPDGINRRYRSSTNNEDLPGFSGAGLYDSKSQKPSEDEDDLAKSLKEVYASLWNFRAFIERDFHRIDHLAAAMGILVHPSYQDEKVNGVAVSFDLIAGRLDYHYVNSQVGEDLVTNPDALSTPEEVLLDIFGSPILLGASNQVAPGQRLMSNNQYLLLHDQLFVIHHHFENLYEPESDEPFAMEIEFKITSENMLAIKQARPWVFRSESQAGDTSEPPPTVTISGTAQVGQTLTADTSGITDEDGLTNVSYSYQWVRNDGNADTDIEGATASTHELSDSDEGKTVRVKVSFTDDADNEESRTSAATATVAVAPRPALTATFPSSPYQSARHKGANDRPQVIIAFSSPVKSFTKATPSVLLTSATVSSMRQHQEDGLENAWIFFLDPDGNEDIEFSLVAGQPCDGGGICTEDGAALSQGAAKTLPGPQEDEPQPDDQQQNNPATGAPTISGTPQVDQTLTADTSAISDEDGLSNISYSYQWIRSDNGADSDIAGATDSTYTLVLADQGKTIKVKVTFTDDRDNEETLTSVATVTVAAAPNRAATGAPTINGTPQVGETLTADTANIADQDGLDDVSYSYQWTAGGADINGATGSSYTLTISEQGQTIQVKVSFTDDRSNAETLTSVATGAVAARPNPLAGFTLVDASAQPQTVLATLTGGEALTLDDPANGSYGIRVNTQPGTDIVSVRLELTGSKSVDQTEGIAPYSLYGDNGESNLHGEDLPVGSYTLTATAYSEGSLGGEELGILTVSFTVAKANSPATGEPTINGTPQVEQTLTADTSAISDTNGLNNVSYQYQWLRDDADIAGQTNSTYELVSADEGKTIKVRVTFTDDTGNAESLTSTATTAVAARPTETPAVLLTASFANVPADHNGNNFIFQLNFSENVEAGYARIRDHAFTVDGATIDSASRIIQGSNQGWNVEVDPTGNEAITITLPETTNCNAARAICTGDSRKLSHPTSATVTGPPAISVSDASVQEADGAILTFTATLSHTSSSTITVGYATSDGTATAGSDYTAANGTLTFDAGDTSKTVQVNVQTDSVEEDQETLTLTLSNPVRATLADATGTGSIENGVPSSGAVVNSPPNGLPAISGTPEVDQTLTANTSAISDADGISNVSYAYQWLADGSAISGATGSSYLLTTTEQGQTIQVKVTFADDADNTESLTSAETLAVTAKPNTAATGEPTISGTPQVDETLTASTSGISDEDGLANVSYQYQWLAGGTEISGATGSSRLLTASELGQTVQVKVNFNDDAGNAESLTSAATMAVSARPTPAVLLTASFANVPADHNGDNFTFQLTFSENVDAGYARIRDHAFSITGGSIASASRITQGSNQGWNVEVNPTGNEAITITLPETTDCSDSGAICTGDERMLSHATSVRVAGPPAIAVSDAAVQEAEGAVLAFSVTLSHASSRTVTVSYTTQDGTATAGSDYTAASGALTFNAGDTSQTVSVTVLTDSDDEGQETLTLTISNPSQATLDDASGIGAIENGESTVPQDDPPAEDPVVDDPVVLVTASFSNMPATHNGTAFTFELDFSENVKAGYARIRDHAFTINGGDITSAVRKEQGSNQGWTITVNPNGNNAITITLPETTGCDDTGAICTYDGRKLSDSTSAQVAGPA